MFKKEAKKKKKDSKSSRTSTNSSISTREIQEIIEHLRYKKHRDTTQHTYYNVWKLFNKFFLQLDKRPSTWEERLTLFVGYLIQNDKQSSTIRSYISAIRSVLRDMNVQLHEKMFLLTSLTKACKLVNDRVYLKLPIHKKILKVLLLKLNELYGGQPYL